MENLQALHPQESGRDGWKESVAGILLLALIGFFTLFWLWGLGRDDTPARLAAQQAEDSESFPTYAEQAIRNLLDRDRLFIQLYGGIQRLSGRRIMEDADPRYRVYTLSDGTLTFVRETAPDPALQLPSFARLKEELDRRGLPFLYVQAPNKLAPGDDRLPQGVSDANNDYADRLLDLLSRLGIATLDLRESFLNAPGGWSSYFFATDHHWKPEGALLACRTLCQTLREDYGLPLDPRYNQESAFTRRVYKNWFLGSQGKRVGVLYGGVDDITAFSPNFRTLFHYQVYSQGINRVGSFDRTLMFYERVAQRDWFGGNPYTLYAGGDYPMARATNYLNPDGPRILLLRDSYACAMTPFLALSCSELYTVDLRYFGENDYLLSYVDWLKPDMVVMMYTAGPLSLDELLRFSGPEASST